MANVTVNFSDSLTPQGSPGLSGKISESGGTLITIDQNYPASTSGSALGTFAFTVANLQAIALKSDQPLTIKTNNNSTPQDTINLVAGALFRWSKSEGYFPTPFAGNVTTAFITCTPAAHLQGLILTNP